MIRRILVLGLAALALLTAAPTASAQPADAIGKPLPDGSMRDGTLMVRVIAGDRSNPVTGADVTLTMTPPNGSSPPVKQVARTDAEGRATFTEVPEGVMVKLTTAGPDGTEVGSSQFPMPQTGGIRVMLSNLPVAGADPMAGGRGPMTPRMMSGQPRPEQADSRDSITVRISYDDFADASPLGGVPIALVAYKHDQTVSGRVVTTDAAGRAVFTGVDPRGATSYFAMTLLPRNGATDRLTSVPILMNGEAGVRVMLSGDKRASTAPPIDDLARLEAQPSKGTVPPGEVRAMLLGVPQPGAAVELVDLVTGAVVATMPAAAPLVDYETRSGFFSEPALDATLAPGTLALSFTRDGKPAPGTTVWVQPAGAPRPEAPTGTADAAGVTTLTGLPTGVALELVVTTGSDPIVKHAFTLPARGGLRSSATLTWTTRGQAGARFTGVAAGADHAYAVRTRIVDPTRRIADQVYISAPFQLTTERGVSISVVVYPRVMFSFSLTSWIDDVYMGVRGQFAINNSSWAPYVASTDGRPDELTIPLPAGFTGAVVRDEFQEVVGVDPSVGFVIRRPIPPGGYEFIAGFSLKIDDGEVRWDMALPRGAYDSGIELKRGDTDVHLDLHGARDAKAEEIDDQRGRFLVVSPITIMPGESMKFTVRDLPRQPAWRRWSKIVVGTIVLWIIALGTLLALWRPRGAVPPEARFDALLDELAALEASGAEPARRAKLMAELEALYRQAGPQR